MNHDIDCFHDPCCTKPQTTHLGIFCYHYIIERLLPLPQLGYQSLKPSMVKLRSLESLLLRHVSVRYNTSGRQGLLCILRCHIRYRNIVLNQLSIIVGAGRLDVKYLPSTDISYVAVRLFEISNSRQQCARLLPGLFTNPYCHCQQFPSNESQLLLVQPVFWHNPEYPLHAALTSKQQAQFLHPMTPVTPGPLSSLAPHSVCKTPNGIKLDNASLAKGWHKRSAVCLASEAVLWCFGRSRQLFHDRSAIIETADTSLYTQPVYRASHTYVSCTSRQSLPAVDNITETRLCSTS